MLPIALQPFMLHEGPVPLWYRTRFALHKYYRWIIAGLVVPSFGLLLVLPFIVVFLYWVLLACFYLQLRFAKRKVLRQDKTLLWFKMLTRKKINSKNTSIQQSLTFVYEYLRCVQILDNVRLSIDSTASLTLNETSMPYLDYIPEEKYTIEFFLLKHQHSLHVDMLAAIELRTWRQCNDVQKWLKTQTLLATALISVLEAGVNQKSEFHLHSRITQLQKTYATLQQLQTQVTNAHAYEI